MQQYYHLKVMRSIIERNMSRRSVLPNRYGKYAKIA